LENTGQVTGHIETHVATVPKEQSLRSEQLSSLHYFTRVLQLCNDQEKMHTSIFCLIFSCKFFHFNTSTLYSCNSSAVRIIQNGGCPLSWKNRKIVTSQQPFDSFWQ